MVVSEFGSKFPFKVISLRTLPPCAILKVIDAVEQKGSGLRDYCIPVPLASSEAPPRIASLEGQKSGFQFAHGESLSTYTCFW